MRTVKHTNTSVHLTVVNFLYLKLKFKKKTKNNNGQLYKFLIQRQLICHFILLIKIENFIKAVVVVHLTM